MIDNDSKKLYIWFFIKRFIVAENGTQQHVTSAQWAKRGPKFAFIPNGTKWLLQKIIKKQLSLKKHTCSNPFIFFVKD